MIPWRGAVVGLVFALTACMPITGTAPADLPAHEGVISRIVDGDTVVFTDDDGAEETVRVIGLDTPETKDPRKGVECGGPEATAFASVTLLGRPVRLIPDLTQDAVDRYQRSLFYVELAERNETTGAPADSDYSTLAAGAGVARAYIYDRAHPPQRIAEIQAAENGARAAGRGIWASCP